MMIGHPKSTSSTTIAVACLTPTIQIPDQSQMNSIYWLETPGSPHPHRYNGNEAVLFHEKNSFEPSDELFLPNFDHDKMDTSRNTTMHSSSLHYHASQQHHEEEKAHNNLPVLQLRARSCLVSRIQHMSSPLMTDRGAAAAVDDDQDNVHHQNADFLSLGVQHHMFLF
jgi:hypothetical protein